MGGDVNGRSKSKVGAMTIVSALAFPMINRAKSHLGVLPHARAMNRSASMASKLSHLGFARPTGRMASAQKASKRTMETEIRKHGSGSIPRQSRQQVVVRT